MDDIIIFGAKYLIFIIAAIAVIRWLTLGRKQKASLALSVIIGLIIAVIIAKIAGKLYYDPRPFVKTGIKPLFSHPADNGFPSDHTYISMTVATAVYFYRRETGILLAVLAVLVGVSRVAAHVHSPIDIIGGLVIGIVAGCAGFYLTRRLYPVPAARKQVPNQGNQGHNQQNMNKPAQDVKRQPAQQPQHNQDSDDS